MRIRFIRSLSPHRKGAEKDINDVQARFLIKHRIAEAVIDEPIKAVKPKKDKKDKKTYDAKPAKKYATKVLTADTED